ncbi:hypothetical protein [Magnetospirillum sp. UT-4]|uniref:hypothetical protein n=1 Tax=Magnetospirillum sp. UT-4 TaxID=2681467 RepID=UPI0013854101|nr:hypothetical protein [Magnetospirillum sp. UT-4]CAA7612138.1 membrane hypothetical protein [Magnetospirillum sp. UT-4]
MTQGWRSFLSRELDVSVVRRGLAGSFLLGVALALNLGLLLLANEVLPLENYGIFYLGISMVNVMTAPSMVISLAFAHHSAQMRATGRHDEADAAFHRYFRRTLAVGLPAAAIVLAALLAVSAMDGPGRMAIAAIVVGIAFLSYLADTFRAHLIGCSRQFAVGLYLLGWTGARLTFGAAALLAAGTALAGLAGILVATLLLLAVSWRLVAPPAGAAAVSEEFGNVLHGRFLAWLAFLNLLPYVDLGIAYLILDKTAFGAYTAAATLPRAALLLAGPIIQTALPLALAGSGRGRQRVALRGWMATAFVTGLTGLSIAVTAHTAGDGRLLNGADTVAVAALCLSTLSASLLRYSATLDLANGRLTVTAGWAIGFFAVSAWCLIAPPATPADLAIRFAIAGTVLVGCHLALGAMWFRHKKRVTAEE